MTGPKPDAGQKIDVHALFSSAKQGKESLIGDQQQPKDATFADMMSALSLEQKPVQEQKVDSNKVRIDLK